AAVPAADVPAMSQSDAPRVRALAASRPVSSALPVHDQIVPPLVPKPLVLTAVNVQQHARHRTPFSPPPILAALLAPCHQTGTLQRLLHPRVAQLDPVLLAKFLVEVPNVQVVVAFLIQPQNFLCRLQGHTLFARLVLPPIR